MKRHIEPNGEIDCPHIGCRISLIFCMGCDLHGGEAPTIECGLTKHIGYDVKPSQTLQKGVAESIEETCMTADEELDHEKADEYLIMYLRCIGCNDLVMAWAKATNNTDLL